MNYLTPIYTEKRECQDCYKNRFIPFHGFFARVLKTGQDILDKELRYRETILHFSIFTIEKHCVIGGIIQDVTLPAVQKEQVIRKAREVIQHNLATVQKSPICLVKMPPNRKSPSTRLLTRSPRPRSTKRRKATGRNFCKK